MGNKEKSIGEMLIEDKKHIKVEGDKLVFDSGISKQTIGTIKDKEMTPEQIKINLQYAYEFIIAELKEYLDLKEEYYNLIALWIIGTYFHEEFPSYPYLFLNAMRGSGKTRTLKLITTLSQEGAMLNSLTEAVLFREKGTLCIDEFEGLGRKGQENLKELLNSAYKKGTYVKRTKKVKKFDGEDYDIEKFDVYRPIVMANIYGLVDEALKDRCITLILEKSSDSSKTNLIELFEFDENIKNAKEILKSCSFSVVSFKANSPNLGTSGLKKQECSLCSFFNLIHIYQEWNKYNKYIYTTTQTTQTTQTTLNKFFNKIKNTNLNGREIELCLPLFIISEQVGVLDDTIRILSKIFQERREEERVENLDIGLYDFFSTQPESEQWISIKNLVNNFKESTGRTEEWINEKWIGRRLNTLKLYKEKKRMGNGIYVIIDYKKAKEKIKIFN